MPGNTALAVNKDIEYTMAKATPLPSASDLQNDGSYSEPERWEETYFFAKNRTETILNKIQKKIICLEEKEVICGKDLLDLEYEPLYEIPAVKNSGKKSHYIVSAEFVTTEDGTGVVHIAPMHGEDDYGVGVQYDLPIASLLDQTGHFNDNASEIVRGFYLKKGRNISRKIWKKED